VRARRSDQNGLFDRTGFSGRVDFLDEEIAALCDAIAAHLAAEHPQPAPNEGPIPFEQAVLLLCSMDGIQQRTTEAPPLIGEFGTDMTRFPTAKHLVSWAAQCPGNHQSAGNRATARPGGGGVDRGRRGRPVPGPAGEARRQACA
jgi:transposase